jgi:ParB/RepB/Spo0J family partition protein
MATGKTLGTTQAIYEIPLKQIHVSKDNVRESRPRTDLDELAASIEIYGLLQPVVLKGEFGTPPYELIGGQRRLLAHVQLGKRTIKSIFAGPGLTKTDVVIRSLVENMQRVELEYEDTARAVTYLYKEYGKDDRKVAESTGLSLRRVRDFIEIDARATPKMKSLMRDREVSPADVKRAIRAAQDDLKKAEELVVLIAKYRNKMTSHQKRRLVRVGKEHSSASAKKIFDEAMMPVIEQNIVITLPDQLMKALEKAMRSLKVDAEELTTQILSDWLDKQGFS